MSVCPSPDHDREFFTAWRDQARPTEWQVLRRREVAIQISDYIMRLRHAGQDVERWLDRLARVCGTTRPEWATRPPKVVRVSPPNAPSAIALARRANKALRARGVRPVDSEGREG